MKLFNKMDQEDEPLLPSSSKRLQPYDVKSQEFKDVSDDDFETPLPFWTRVKNVILRKPVFVARTIKFKHIEHPPQDQVKIYKNIFFRYT